MIEERARVIAVGEGYAWVETYRQTACGSCSSPGCGTATLSKLLGTRPTRVRALTALPLQAGDEVIIGVAEMALLKSSLVVYLLPLLLLLLGALVGKMLIGNELAAILLGLGGLAVGFAGLRSVSQRLVGDPRWQPVVLAVGSLADGQRARY